jgi:hypothetical protein
MHRRRKRVVRGLRHVYVVIRMNRFFAAFLTTGQLDRAIRDDLVRVHVGLGSTSSLLNAQREMVIEFSCNDLVCRRDDQLGFLFGQLSQISINECRGLLKNAVSPYQFGRH